MRTYFLGDIHGDSSSLTRLARTSPLSEFIQVGDFGIGFPGYQYTPLEPNIKFIRGNHDNPVACHAHPSYLGDYGVHNGMFFLSGAWSIDRSVRVEDIDWWAAEELPTPDLQAAIDLYNEVKPEVVFSHTCPTPIAKMICMGHYYGSRTENALANMWFGPHRPKMWIFGHWHQSWRQNVYGTDFVCLNCDESFSI